MTRLRRLVLGLAWLLPLAGGCQAVRLADGTKSQPEPRKPTEEGEGVPGYALVPPKLSASASTIAGSSGAVISSGPSGAGKATVSAWALFGTGLDQLRSGPVGATLKAHALGSATVSSDGAFQIATHLADVGYAALIVTLGTMDVASLSATQSAYAYYPYAAFQPLANDHLERLASADRGTLVLGLQPAGTGKIYETLYQSIAAALAGEHYFATYLTRAALPVITKEALTGQHLVILHNGCGGATGVPAPDEVAALRSFHEAGGDLYLVADDGNGDATAPGDCQSRVNAVAGPLGLAFTGTFTDPTGGPCVEANGLSALTSGLKLSRSTGAVLTRTTPAWGDASWQPITAIAGSQSQEAYLAAANGRGFVVFSPEFGSPAACDGPTYLRRIVRSSVGLPPGEAP